MNQPSGGRGIRAIGGIGIVLALLLALQIGLSPALGDSERERIVSTFAGSATEDYTCTAGPTGNCNVVYQTMHSLTIDEAFVECGEKTCKVRIETRW